MKAKLLSEKVRKTFGGQTILCGRESLFLAKYAPKCCVSDQQHQAFEFFCRDRTWSGESDV